MSKPIKVEEKVYDQLDQLRGKGETFSEVVEGLLTARSKMCETFSLIEGALKFREWRDEKLNRAYSLNQHGE